MTLEEAFNELTDSVHHSGPFLPHSDWPVRTRSVSFPATRLELAVPFDDDLPQPNELPPYFVDLSTLTDGLPGYCVWPIDTDIPSIQQWSYSLWSDSTSHVYPPGDGSEIATVVLQFAPLSPGGTSVTLTGSRFSPDLETGEYPGDDGKPDPTGTYSRGGEAPGSFEVITGGECGTRPPD